MLPVYLLIFLFASIWPDLRAMEQQESLEASNVNYPFTLKKDILDAIQESDRRSFLDELNIIFADFKRDIRSSVNSDGPLAGFDECDSFQTLTQFLLYAFRARSFESVRRLSEISQSNGLCPILHTSPQDKIRLAHEIRRHSDRIISMLYKYKSFAFKKSFPLYAFHYAHLYGIPILIALYCLYLVLKPLYLHELSLSTILLELKIEAIPVYCLIGAYVFLHLLKYAVTPGPLGTFQVNSIGINERLADTIAHLTILRNSLKEHASSNETEQPARFGSIVDLSVT